jgi:hypothetical protein
MSHRDSPKISYRVTHWSTNLFLIKQIFRHSNGSLLTTVTVQEKDASCVMAWAVSHSRGQLWSQAGLRYRFLFYRVVQKTMYSCAGSSRFVVYVYSNVIVVFYEQQVQIPYTVVFQITQWNKKRQHTDFYVTACTNFHFHLHENKKNGTLYNI